MRFDVRECILIRILERGHLLGKVILQGFNSHVLLALYLINFQEMHLLHRLDLLSTLRFQVLIQLPKV
jgi:hypothetical protein